MVGPAPEERGRVLIIAEAGVNHNGSLDMALEMVDVAAECGADIIKFQTFKPELVTSRNAAKAEYQKASTGEGESQLDMIRRYELSGDAHIAIIERCRERGVEFFSTPFDAPSVDLLVSLGLGRLKIPSGEITDWPLLRKIGETGKPVIMSTGMSTLQEIREAMGVFLLGALRSGIIPSAAEAEKIFCSYPGREYLEKNMTLLHCTTQYPTPYKDVNLRAMDLLTDEFGLPVGYSDHTEGIAVSLAAAARGASVIEKHFTLDKNLPGPDHRASVDPGELHELVSGIRAVEFALGTYEKAVAPSEMKNRDVARRSLVAFRKIEKGELFTEQNLGAKRPGTGISAARFWEYLGTASEKNYMPDDLIG
ncbi:MAG: N-acetylneuraminate synthase [Synergistaceae bacterium]|nr:N-acetylneuraminate synthase [Synergistaceae bacterium]